MIVNQTIFNCSLEEVLDELEIQLRANGGLDYFSKRKDTPDNIMVCCPYHQERNPSAGIRKEDGLFHCFACGETHTLNELITSSVFNKALVEDAPNVTITLGLIILISKNMM